MADVAKTEALVASSRASMFKRLMRPVSQEALLRLTILLLTWVLAFAIRLVSARRSPNVKAPLLPATLLERAVCLILYFDDIDSPLPRQHAIVAAIVTACSVNAALLSFAAVCSAAYLLCTSLLFNVVITRERALHRFPTSAVAVTDGSTAPAAPFLPAAVPR